jgi:hypothetical protein
METKIELTKCPDCQVDPGERHQDGCDVARCRFVGRQYISCFDIKVLPDGSLDFLEPTDHACEPDRWTGEWPGVKVCRDNNWYNAPDSIFGYSEDLNSVPFRAVWNPELEDWEARK